MADKMAWVEQAERPVAPELKRRLRERWGEEETVSWVRWLPPGSGEARAVEAITPRQVVVGHVGDVQRIMWGNVGRVTLERHVLDRCTLTVVSQAGSGLQPTPQRALTLAHAGPTRVVQRAVELALFEATSDEVEWGSLEPPLGHASVPPAWLGRVQGELVRGERLLWVGRGQPGATPHRLGQVFLALLGRTQGRTVSVLGPLTAFCPFVVAITTGAFNPLLFFLPGLLWFLALAGYAALTLRGGRLYAITERRALQLSSLDIPSGPFTTEFYPHLDPREIRVQPHAFGPFADVRLTVEQRTVRGGWDEQPIAFHGLPTAEAEVVVALLQKTYARASAPPPARAPLPGQRTSVEEIGYLLAEYGARPLDAAAQTRLHEALDPSERLLWVGHTRVPSQEQPLQHLVYGLTAQRALVLGPNGVVRSAPWKQAVRVAITRWPGGRGNLAIVTHRGSANSYCDELAFSFCPQIAIVQQIVERIFFEEDSDPSSAPVGDEPGAHRDVPLPEGGLPSRWWARLAAELLPGEEVRWAGRADAATAQRSLRGCMVQGGGLLLVIGMVLAAMNAGRISDEALLPVLCVGGFVLALLVVTLVYFYLVLLDSVYAVTNRRAMVVTGLRRRTPWRIVEFYPNLDPKRVGKEPEPHTSVPASLGPEVADVLLLTERYAISSNRRQSPRVNHVSFSAIPRTEVERVTALIREAYGGS